MFILFTFLLFCAYPKTFRWRSLHFSVCLSIGSALQNGRQHTHERWHIEEREALLPGLFVHFHCTSTFHPIPVSVIALRCVRENVKYILCSKPGASGTFSPSFFWAVSSNTLLFLPLAVQPTSQLEIFLLQDSNIMDALAIISRTKDKDLQLVKVAFVIETSIRGHVPLQPCFQDAFNKKHWITPRVKIFLVIVVQSVKKEA